MTSITPLSLSSTHRDLPLEPSEYRIDISTLIDTIKKTSNLETTRYPETGRSSFDYEVTAETGLFGSIGLSGRKESRFTSRLPCGQDLLIEGFTEKTLDRLRLLHNSNMDEFSPESGCPFEEGGATLNQLLKEELPDQFKNITIAIEGPPSSIGYKITVEESYRDGAMKACLRFNLNSIYFTRGSNAIIVTLIES